MSAGVGETLGLALGVDVAAGARVARGVRLALGAAARTVLVGSGGGDGSTGVAPPQAARASTSRLLRMKRMERILARVGADHAGYALANGIKIALAPEPFRGEGRYQPVTCTYTEAYTSAATNTVTPLRHTNTITQG
jgi:hypothetical protein